MIDSLVLESVWPKRLSTLILIWLIGCQVLMGQNVPQPKFKLLKPINTTNVATPFNTKGKQNPLKNKRLTEQQRIAQQNWQQIQDMNFRVRQRKHLYDQILAEEKKEEEARIAQKVEGIIKKTKVAFHQSL